MTIDSSWVLVTLVLVVVFLAFLVTVLALCALRRGDQVATVFSELLRRLIPPSH